jgi:D-serine deaminase-like pyridoxal phosphate-dependent protein
MSPMPLRVRTEYRIGGSVASLPDANDYAIADPSRLLTPALLVYPDWVDANIATVIALLAGDASRWRAHVKSAKLPSVMGQLVAAGVTYLKCATTLELEVACDAGARDVLLAYPVVGPKVQRVQSIARAHSSVSVSALVENADPVGEWKDGGVGLFVDVNPGMDRTGIPDTATEQVVATVRAIAEAGLRFGGVHYYDGHVSANEGEAAQQAAHRGYDRLLHLVSAIEHAGIVVPEIITAGTPGLPCSLSYAGFETGRPVHRVSPGTIVYNDASSAGQLPADWDLRPAAIVAATVVSHPAPGRVTCDAGHKAVSADAGVPTCVVLGRPDLEPLRPSEEHLPIAVPVGARVPAIGEILYLVPRHVCPTVNNFDHAVIVRGGRIAGTERVAARGREQPVLS